ncbi:MAG: nucleotidyltransferase domain-containing protein [Desulfuromonadaceae bacterium]
MFETEQVMWWAVPEKSVSSKYGLRDRDMQTITDIFTRYPHIKTVHLFGSRAKGTFHSGSDIDLAVMNKDVPPKSMLQLQNEFSESSLPYFVDLVYYPDIESATFREHIERVGVVIYSAED